MAGEATTDMLMRFFTADGTGVPAECQLTISPNDKLAQEAQLSSGFTAGNSLDYFLVSQFAFGAELRDSESRNTGPTGTKAPALRGVPGYGTAGMPGMGYAPPGFYPNAPASQQRPPKEHGRGPAQGGAQNKNPTHGAARMAAQQNTPGAFARWRSATDDSWKQAGAYPAYMDDFRFTRLIDQASPVLFDYSCNRKPFPFVTLIKRKAAVATASLSIDAGGGTEQLSYLRIDLADVLITSISWNDGDILEESCQMKCQKMKLTYYQQNNDGTLTPIDAVDWELPVIKPK
jgi:type VI protein secretion system component Hcp